MNPVAFLSLLLPFAFLSSSPTLPEEDIVLSGDGDHFHLLDASFSQEESFVYTAKASFASGQAAGILIGGSEGNYLVFNVDRYENATKLLHFHQEESGMAVDILASERFLGTATTQESEYNQIGKLLRNSPDFYFRVDLEVKEEGTFASFYLDNIRRFDLSAPIALPSYSGGQLGFNSFSSEVTFSDVTIGESPYSYYSEPYRNQYHYSQFAHWNNDPNGMIYYQGYYHLYYQTNPTSKFWGDMYWGHARSKDLVHWEELPHALFPDDGTMGFGEGAGYAWSGSAMVYHKGMSDAIDSQNWFPKGNGEGILIAYTRDGPRQDQVIASSDDGGMSFTKRVFLPQSLYKDGGKCDFRDPKIFPVEKNGEGKVTRYGMVLSDQGGNRVVFLTSTDLISWAPAGGFSYPRPECVDVLSVTANDGTVHTVLTFMGRQYIVGDFQYRDSQIHFVDQSGVDLCSSSKATYLPMDYAKDRYATQSFFIDDPSSPYYGKAVSMSWFSGVPGDGDTVESGVLASYRSSWNGGGQSFPVEEGLIRESDGSYSLAETPVSFPSSSLSTLFEQTGLSLDSETENPLGNLQTNSAKITASFAIQNGTNVEFDLFSGEGGSLKVGYDATLGYYVDRSSASGKEFGIHAYDRRWQAGTPGDTTVDFTMLLDHGSLEVFCENGRYPFYVLHLSSPMNRGLGLSVSGSASANLRVEAIASSYKTGNETEGMLFLSDLSAELDLTLSTKKRILAYDSASHEVAHELLEGKGVVSLTPFPGGVELTALSAGSAKIRFSNSAMSKTVEVTVHQKGDFTSPLVLDQESLIAGNWMETERGIVGEKTSGDGILISANSASDFSFRATVNLQGAACGLVFNASRDGKEYFVANFDAAGKVSKLFSKNFGVLGQKALGGIDPSSFTLGVEKEGMGVRVLLNGAEVMNLALPEGAPSSGYLGLNVFSGKATFSSIAYSSLHNDYQGGDMVVPLGGNAEALCLTNVTRKNKKVDPSLYAFEKGTLTIQEEYMSSLSEGIVYHFSLVTTKETVSFYIRVLEVTPYVLLESLTLNQGSPYSALIRGIEIASVRVNDKEAEFTYENDILRIEGDAFSVGENQVIVNDTYEATVTVLPLSGASRNGLAAFLASASGYLGATSLLYSGVMGVTALIAILIKNHKKERNVQK